MPGVTNVYDSDPTKSPFNYLNNSFDNDPFTSAPTRSHAAGNIPDLIGKPHRMNRPLVPHYIDSVPWRG